MAPPSPAKKPELRHRSSSVSQTIDKISTYTDPNSGSASASAPANSSTGAANALAEQKKKKGSSGSGSGRAPPVAKATAEKRAARQEKLSLAEQILQDAKENRRRSIFYELYSLRWMIDPTSSIKIIGLVVGLWASFHLVAPSTQSNPFSRLLFLSHPVPTAQVLLAEPGLAARLAVNPHADPAGLLRYQKGYWDLSFIAFYIVVFSFVRQSITLYLFKPFAQWYGITNETKQVRLMEQGYAFCYWGTFGLLGLYVMKFQDSWWYQLEHLWLKYPHWQMRPELKAYYLLQLSYWLQQALVMLLRLEKPRKDYYELIAHHLVTLWLVGWSYMVNLTMIGTTVFVAMDIPDTWLAASKFLNYLDAGLAIPIVFASFMVIWTYFRIYLSAKTLWSVWYQSLELIPAHTREWNPAQGWWLVSWMRYQIFAPLFLLLLLNLFWYVLMWRILLRALTGVYADEREEGEFDDEGATDANKKPAGGNKKKSS